MRYCGHTWGKGTEQGRWLRLGSVAFQHRRAGSPLELQRPSVQPHGLRLVEKEAAFCARSSEELKTQSPVGATPFSSSIAASPLVQMGGAVSAPYGMRCKWQAMPVLSPAKALQREAAGDTGLVHLIALLEEGRTSQAGEGRPSQRTALVGW